MCMVSISKLPRFLVSLSKFTFFRCPSVKTTFFEYSVANFANVFALPTFGWFQILLCSTRCTRYVIGMSGAAVTFILHRMDTLVRRPNRLALGPVTEIGRPV